MTDRRRQPRPIPGSQLRGRREPGPVDVDHARIGSAELVDSPKGVGVDLPGEGQTVPPRLGEADELFEPGRAGCLYMNSGPAALEGPADNGIEGKLVAPAVDGELEPNRQAVVGRRMGKDGQIVVELALEGDEITDVIDPLVKPAGELRGDRVERDAFIGQQAEDHQQLARRLRAFGLVHAHFRDKPGPPLPRRDVAVDRASLPGGEEIVAGDRCDDVAGEDERLCHPRHIQRACQLRMAGHEGSDLRRRCRIADRVGDIDREEIARVEKPVDRLQADVVGIDKPRMAPAPLFHRLGRGRPDARRLATDEAVLAIRFIPYRSDEDPVGLELLKGRQLGGSLMGKTVSDTERQPGEAGA